MDQVRIFPTAFFAPPGYYKALLSSSFLIDGKEFFVKQSLRSRYQILGPNGILVLSIPVKKPNGSKTRMEEAEIDDSRDWRAIHLKSIFTAYGSAPFFDHYFYDLSILYSANYEKLMELNNASLTMVKSWFNLDFKVQTTSSFYPLSKEEDFRTKDYHDMKQPPYNQVFSDRFSFTPNLSIIDLVMNEGPMGRSYMF